MHFWSSIAVRRTVAALAGATMIGGGAIASMRQGSDDAPERVASAHVSGNVYIPGSDVGAGTGDVTVTVPELADVPAVPALPSMPAGSNSTNSPTRALASVDPAAVLNVVQGVAAQVEALMPDMDKLAAAAMTCASVFADLATANVPSPTGVAGTISGLLGGILGGGHATASAPTLDATAITAAADACVAAIVGALPAEAAAAVGVCHDAFAALIPAVPTSTGAISGLLGGLLGGKLPAVPTIDPAAVTAAADACVHALLGVLPDAAFITGIASDALEALTGLLGAAPGTDALMAGRIEAFIAQLTMVANDPGAILGDLTAMLGEFAPVDPMVAIDILGAVADGLLAPVATLLASHGVALPVDAQHVLDMVSGILGLLPITG